MSARPQEKSEYVSAPAKIWEQEGRPRGQSERHWRMAEKAVGADEHAVPEVLMGQPKDEVAD